MNIFKPRLSYKPAKRPRLLPKLEIYIYRTNIWKTSIHKWVTVMGKHIMVLNKINATVS